MDKKKFEILILIIIVAFGLNYGLYEFYLKPQQQSLRNLEESYKNKKREIRDLKNKVDALQLLEESIEERLKSSGETGELGEAVDNQKLIRDFYAACQQYGVQGDTLIIANDQAAPIEGNIEEESAEDNLNPITDNLKAKTIVLTFSGEKAKVENFIKNIRNVSSKKLILSSVDLASVDTQGFNINNTEETATEVITGNVTLIGYSFNNPTEEDLHS
jgi:hypothetical protein